MPHQFSVRKFYKQFSGSVSLKRLKLGMALILDTEVYVLRHRCEVLFNLNAIHLHVARGSCINGYVSSRIHSTLARLTRFFKQARVSLAQMCIHLMCTRFSETDLNHICALKRSCTSLAWMRFKSRWAQLDFTNSCTETPPMLRLKRTQNAIYPKREFLLKSNTFTWER